MIELSSVLDKKIAKIFHQKQPFKALIKPDSIEVSLECEADHVDYLSD